MPPYIGRSAGLVTQPSTHQLAFRSPVPTNPMLIPNFLQREVAPRHHTHSQGDITGAGAGASAAERGIHMSIGPELNGLGGSINVYFEVRDGLSSRVSMPHLIEAFTDSIVNPPIAPRGNAISTAVVTTGLFYASIGPANKRALDFLFMTTSAGSAVVQYQHSIAAISVHLGAVLIGPKDTGGPMVFTV